MQGWYKIKESARYAGVSVRTLRNWLKQGLQYARMKTGTILIKVTWIDEFIESFKAQDYDQNDGKEIDRIVGECIKGFKKK